MADFEKVRYQGLYGEGSFWMLVRTGNAGDLDTPQGIAESFSTDHGLSWTTPKPSAIKHTASRFHISRLQSGESAIGKTLGH